jgi:hypothetical protein
VKGKRFGGKKPVFVVASNRTFSGGEELYPPDHHHLT